MCLYIENKVDLLTGTLLFTNKAIPALPSLVLDLVTCTPEFNTYFSKCVKQHSHCTALQDGTGIK